MGKPITKHLPQHKPQRETQKAHELSDLKRENHQLKRTVSRLRKQIEKMEAMLGELAPEVEESPTEEAPEQAPANDGSKCPACNGADLATFGTPGGKTLILCRGCKHRIIR